MHSTRSHAFPGNNTHHTDGSHVLQRSMMAFKIYTQHLIAEPGPEAQHNPNSSKGAKKKETRRQSLFVLRPTIFRHGISVGNLREGCQVDMSTRASRQAHIMWHELVLRCSMLSSCVRIVFHGIFEYMHIPREKTVSLSW